MIRAIIELELIFPYKRSMATLAEFCSLWDSTIFSGGTAKLKAIVAMPSHHFKHIFGHNPIEGTYDVPSGMGRFVETLKVKKVMVR